LGIGYWVLGTGKFHSDTTIEPRSIEEVFGIRVR